MIRIPIDPPPPPDDASPDEPKSNVIPFDPGIRIATFYSPLPHCGHQATEVDDRARVVRCATCEVLLDPIDVLMMFARDGSSIKWQQKERKRLAEEIADMKETATKLRASVRGLAKRRGIAPCAHCGELGFHKTWCSAKEVEHG